MPTFLVIGRHPAENCPMFNEKTRKVAMKLFDKQDELLKKHRIKSLGSWTVVGEHQMIALYEAPSYEAFEKLSMEPEFLAIGAFETMETKALISNEEISKMLRQVK
jgi:uncharacterized protein with GYD domain